MYLYLKSSKPEKKYIPEKVNEIIELDWEMSVEDWLWFFCAGVIAGAWMVMIYLVL